MSCQRRHPAYFTLSAVSLGGLGKKPEPVVIDPASNVLFYRELGNQGPKVTDVPVVATAAG